MKKTSKRISVYVLFLIVLCSCSEYIRKDQLIEESLREVLVKYPELPKGNNRLTDYYKIYKSTFFREADLEVQVREGFDSINYGQIIVICKDRKVYTLPFFNNSNSDYWQFEFEGLHHSQGISFKNELKRAYLYLFNKTPTADAYYSLIRLFSNTINIQDTSYIALVHMIRFKDSMYKFEPKNVCEKRLTEIRQFIYEKLKKGNLYKNYILLGDNRIYCIVQSENCNSDEGKIFIFRLSCNDLEINNL